jgi:hypothetical protein
MATTACPTPTYDQTVFRYNASQGHLEYLWTVPDRETALVYKANKNQIVPAERPLLKFVLDFFDGTLLKQAKKFNKEAMHAGGLLEIHA